MRPGLHVTPFSCHLLRGRISLGLSDMPLHCDNGGLNTLRQQILRECMDVDVEDIGRCSAATSDFIGMYITTL